MGHPGAVTAVAELAQLVLAHLGQRILGHDRVAAVGDEGGHAADGVGAALVAGVHQQLGVGAHEGHGHGDLGTVGQDQVVVLGELLDGAEDVVPAPGVEAGGVVADLVEDLFHLEGAEDGFDQDRGADGAAGDAELVLGSR